MKTNHPFMKCLITKPTKSIYVEQKKLGVLMFRFPLEFMENLTHKIFLKEIENYPLYKETQ